MPNNTIYITESDMARLRVLTEARYLAHAAQLEALQRLEEELDRAEIVEPTDLPGDVVTMTSRVKVRDLDNRQVFVYQLAFPAQARRSSESLSVLSPLGTALLGQRVGDRLEARTPGGIRRLEVLELLHQPERSRKIA